MKGIAHFDTAAQGNSEMSYLFSVVVGISFWPVSKGGIPDIVFTS